MTIGFSLDVLLAFDFNRDEFLCIFFSMYNVWRLLVEDVFLGRASIILSGLL